MKCKVEDLRSANEYLSAILKRWQSSPALTGSHTAREFHSLRAGLSRAARCVEELSLHSESSPQITEAIADHGKVLQQLAKMLPAFRVGLEARKARLQADLDHMERTAVWIAASLGIR
ncbi:MAG: hypothetical protein JOZ80_16870 [Acidobacteriaceae bacterium]|nr:hypothetical protein [Acidobacteriaceae bacterium]